MVVLMGRKKNTRRGKTSVERSDDDLRALLLEYVRRDDDAFEAVARMHDPDQCWRLIELARASDLTDEQLAFVSAGPFEDLMGRHGEAFIDRVEVAARQDAKMRLMIATVWRGGMSETVWRRVEGLRARLRIRQL
jgi:hypothetical protein